MNVNDDAINARLINSMKERMPWRVASHVMKEAGLIPGHGWDRTFEKLSNPSTELDIDPLVAMLQEHVLGGEKYVTLIEAQKETITSLVEHFASIDIPTSDAQKAFPLSLTDEELNGTELDVVPIKVIQSDKGTAVVFSSIRFFASKEEITADDLPEDSEFIFRDFDEIIGFRNRRVQAFDVAWLPHGGGAIEIRVDYPSGMNKDIATAVYQHVEKKLASVLGAPSLGNPINLFPAIKAVYENAREGNVVELAFSTTTGSVKQERMRRQRTCLRKEDYHVGGKNALAHEIEPFRLGVVWTRDKTRRPEILLAGSSRIGLSNNPELWSAVVRNCTNLEDYEFVVSRLKSNLP